MLVHGAKTAGVQGNNADAAVKDEPATVGAIHANYICYANWGSNVNSPESQVPSNKNKNHNFTMRRGPEEFYYYWTMRAEVMGNNMRFTRMNSLFNKGRNLWHIGCLLSVCPERVNINTQLLWLFLSPARYLKKTWLGVNISMYHHLSQRRLIWVFSAKF